MDPAILFRAGLLIAFAYVAGSVPVGSIVAQRVGGPDLRSVGSGRTGGTNALRALGRKWAAVVVLGDLLKGALPVLVARFVTGDPLGTSSPELEQSLQELGVSLRSLAKSARMFSKCASSLERP